MASTVPPAVPPAGRIVRRRPLSALLGLCAFGLLVAAVVKELRLPKRKRRWHGTVAGVFPYDLRPPTLKRARERLSNPKGPLLSQHVFGVGWTINFGRLAALLRGRA
jgi:Family of unknown function (DUF5808)